jgi:hypothetical protein
MRGGLFPVSKAEKVVNAETKGVSGKSHGRTPIENHYREPHEPHELPPPHHPTAAIPCGAACGVGNGQR